MIPVRHSRGPPNPNPNPNPNARPREWRTPGMGGRYPLHKLSVLAIHKTMQISSRPTEIVIYS